MTPVCSVSYVKVLSKIEVLTDSRTLNFDFFLYVRLLCYFILDTSISLDSYNDCIAVIFGEHCILKIHIRVFLVVHQCNLHFIFQMLVIYVDHELFYQTVHRKLTVICVSTISFIIVLV